LGRPNVGKSSLFNKLVGEEMSIVSPIEHTTREPHDITVQIDDLTLTFIDTAGIRRKSKVEKGIEEASVEKTKDALKRADVVLFMIDVSQNITQQDRHLAELIATSDAGIIIIANKWDLIEGKVVETQNEIKRNIYRNFPFMTWVPVYFVSAKTGQHVPKIIDLIKELEKDRSVTVEQEWLNSFIKRATIHHKPMASTGIRRPKILDFEQIQTNPPVFQLRIRQTDTISTQYLRYLENQLREALGIKGSKLWITVKK
ncbi:50S ribosome-binding GTPase, partial [Candidatus Falkowbacteria bacterium]|nr:50S ribosome-binding GTPase [Candidatus Falkowbacteria bacterium]